MHFGNPSKRENCQTCLLKSYKNLAFFQFFPPLFGAVTCKSCSSSSLARSPCISRGRRIYIDIEHLWTAQIIPSTSGADFRVRFLLSLSQSARICTVVLGSSSEMVHPALRQHLLIIHTEKLKFGIYSRCWCHIWLQSEVEATDHFHILHGTVFGSKQIKQSICRDFNRSSSGLGNPWFCEYLERFLRKERHLSLPQWMIGHLLGTGCRSRYVPFALDVVGWCGWFVHACRVPAKTALPSQ